MPSLESLWIWAGGTSFVVLVIYLIGTWTHSYFAKRNVPSLKTVPFLGNMGPIVFRTMSFPDLINHMYNGLKGHKYGGVYEFLNPVVLLRDPELIKRVTVKDFEFFLDHRSPINEEAEPLLGKGLINLSGQRWKDMRSTLSPVFTSSKMKMMFKLITDCGDQLSKFLVECIQNEKMSVEECKIERNGDMLEIEMKDLFTRYTNDVIATSAFGIGCNSLKNPTNEFYEMGKDITNFAGIRTLILFGYLMSSKLMKMLNIKFLNNSVAKFFHSLVHDTMAVRESKGIFRPDMIHLLMQAKKGTLKGDENDEAIGNAVKPKWDDDDVTSQALLFFFAGFDTASTLLCFTSHQLAVHPDIQSRLQYEIDKTLQGDDGKLTYEAVHNMKYLDMVVSETLRMYPPAIITDRKCIKTYTLPTKPLLTLKPGDGVWVPIYSLHHDPDNFPDPEKFDPERFSDENKDNIKPFTYLPFGSGPRNCIGMRFALMEAKVALVYLLSHFNLKVISRTPIPIQISKKGFNMAVDEGFWLGLEQRIKN